MQPIQPSTPRSIRRARPTRHGLTLIEVLIVIAILVTIGGLVVVNVLPQKEEADRNLVQEDIDRMYNGLDQFKLAMNRYPTEDEGLAVLWNPSLVEEDTDAEPAWKTAYMRDPKPRDVWGNEWIYRFPGELRGEQYPDIISVGPDGEEGTEDDITNHSRLMDEDGESAEDLGVGIEPE